MKSPWKQFQDQQHQQRQRLMQGADWLEQQKRIQQPMSAQTQLRTSQQIGQRFSQVEQEVTRLRQQFAAGKLSQESLEAKLRELMVQDASGNWWMVGTESGRWYRYDGQKWVIGTPLGGDPTVQQQDARITYTATKGGNIFKTIVISILLVAISYFLFAVLVNIIRMNSVGVVGLFAILLVVGVGLVGIVKLARKIARRL